MKFELKITKQQTVDLSEEDCDAILISTIARDWDSFNECGMDKYDLEAIKVVYYIYSGKVLV
jgi:hypothetical protein